MSRKNDLLKEKEIKLLFKYTIPCVLGMLGLSLCILVDTIFIGRKLGSLGLAALNISLPTYSIFNAIALTFGVGGATAFSISLGEGKQEKANEIFTSALFGALAISIFLSLINIFFIDKICYGLGASSQTFPLVKDYVGMILFFNWAFIFVSILNVFVRSDRAPKLAMTAMISANLTNIVLDYIFIFPLNMGLKGAALATSLGQVVGIAILLLHFIKGNNTMALKVKTFSFPSLFRIIKNGFTSFITELSGGYVIFIFNIAAFNVLGDIGVSAYSIINNIVLIFIAVFNGLAQGIQPLISINYGAKKTKRVHKFLKQGIIIAFILGAIFLSSCLLFPEALIGLFTTDKGTLLEITLNGCKIYLLSLLFSGMNMVIIGYLQAIENSTASLLLSLSKGILFITLYLLILPRFWNVNGIWAAVPFSEITTLLLAALILLFLKKKNKEI